jgi:hypothetical protein
MALGPVLSGYFGYDGGRGEIKLTLAPRTVDPKLAEVYVNNAFAGAADHLKNMWLEPGAYELSILSKGRTAYLGAERQVAENCGQA